MSKIVIGIKNERTETVWTEEYEADGLTDPDFVGRRRRRTDRVSVNNQEEAQEWAEALIKGFNDSLMPGESPRVLRWVQYLSDDDGEKQKT